MSGRPIPLPAENEKAGVFHRGVFPGDIFGAVFAAFEVAAARGVRLPWAGVGFVLSSMGGPPPERDNLRCFVAGSGVELVVCPAGARAYGGYGGYRGTCGYDPVRLCGGDRLWREGGRKAGGIFPWTGHVLRGFVPAGVGAGTDGLCPG